MITKQFRITVVLLSLAAMASLHVSAGQVLRKGEPLKIREQVYLNAKYEFSAFGPQLRVSNNTNATIPQGTTIYWSINGPSASDSSSQLEKKGLFPLQRALPRDEDALHRVPWSWSLSAIAKAWYFK